MIEIVRGTEPNALTAARDEHLSRAKLRGRPPRETEFADYDAGRAALLDLQRAKCAYCEIDLRAPGAHVEHFRPKSDPDRVDWRGLKPAPSGTPSIVAESDERRFALGHAPTQWKRIRWVSAENEGYWWLAWTFENHLVACNSCDSSLKGSRFPLARGSAVLRAEQPPPGNEDALLIDPSACDPLDHIRFEDDGRHWRPVARDDSVRGAWTISVLGLAEPGLLDKYRRHVRELSQKKCIHRLDDQSGEERKRYWPSVCAELLDLQGQFLGLTYDWLVQRYSDAGLVVPRPRLYSPGTATRPSPLPAMSPIPALDGIPDRLQWFVRVARNHSARSASSEELPLPALVRELAAARPWTLPALAELLSRDQQTVRRALGLAGCSFDPATRTWHA